MMYDFHFPASKKYLLKFNFFLSVHGDMSTILKLASTVKDYILGKCRGTTFMLTVFPKQRIGRDMN